MIVPNGAETEAALTDILLSLNERLLFAIPKSMCSPQAIFTIPHVDNINRGTSSPAMSRRLERI